ncbi:stage II sporulation protein P [Acetonema longum]|uniref:Stage II sporulation protein P n=1 Tax=Acetonema longum DSM 6540 TaxID=1009370 RepID=F7NM77_9FIRM|nr:stage II sporulation protein P [Acetonema longum]EGO62878.1 stage II sporulation protein P [Acetonema longum DSM 6540]
MKLLQCPIIQIRIRQIILLTLLGLLLWLPTTVKAENELADSAYFTVVDEAGNIILETGMEVRVGDQFIDEDDRLFEITTVEDKKAHAVRQPETGALELFDDAVPAQASPTPNAPLIAVYHTHTDESYIPTDGTDSQKGRGSIMKVGDAFVARLQELGYRVVHSKTLHDPHDANAYYRSRRTAVKLLNNRPAALFDVHRNSAPLRTYYITIGGKEATKMLLVVGRQNQYRMTTQGFARRVKAAVDAKYKGLIRGIFLAHGNYNQDLSPRALLLEVGTQFNKRAVAERSIQLFADALPSIIPLPPPQTASAADSQQPPIPGTVNNNNQPPPGTPSGAAGTAGAGSLDAFYNILAIVGLVVLGAGAFLYLSSGSWGEVKQKLSRLRNVEFTNFLGPWRKKVKAWAKRRKP